ncbi:MAG TPA: hypothetical protein VF815_31460 [Myxococcaceae bacterium]
MAAVLTSHPLALEASVPAHLGGGAALLSPPSRETKLHLLDTRFTGQSEDHGRFTRYLAEYLGGLGIGLVGVVAGVVALPTPWKLTDAPLPMALGVVGSSMGVTLAGWALDGRGSFVFALLGSVIGLAAPFLAGAGILMASGCDLQAYRNCGAVEPMIVGMLLLTPLGGIVGYELSAPTPWLDEDYASRTPGPVPRFAPVLTLARQGVGGTLGIAWSM